jgi:hypothetical protein
MAVPTTDFLDNVAGSDVMRSLLRVNSSILAAVFLTDARQLPAAGSDLQLEAPPATANADVVTVEPGVLGGVPVPHATSWLTAGAHPFLVQMVAPSSLDLKGKKHGAQMASATHLALLYPYPRQTGSIFMIPGSSITFRF